METFVQNADAIRRQLGWTHDTLADRCGIDRTTLSKILGGKRLNVTVATVQRIADALKTPLHSLFSPTFSPRKRKSA